LTLKTPISNRFSYHTTVFLFNKTIVAFMVRAASGKLNAVLEVPVKELVVDELVAIVAVDTEHEERQAIPGMGDFLFNPAVGVVQKGAFFSPAGTHIGNGQSLAKLA
jgi:hypothetical protein